MSPGGPPSPEALRGPEDPETEAGAHPAAASRDPGEHPSLFEPGTLLLGLLMAVLGAVIGIQLLTRVGVTPNSSVIAAILAIAVARIPLAVCRPFANLARQNLMQTVISGATFGGANALLLPIGIPWLVGRPDLVLPMLAGAFLALVVDATILYRVFDSQTYPASGLWPSGVATAEVLLAGDRGGRRAGLLAAGGAMGGAGQLLGIPMDVFGVCWIGNAWALSLFALGLLARAYAPVLLGMDLGEEYVPHGLMIGAGVVALIQMGRVVAGSSRPGRPRGPGAPDNTSQADPGPGLDGSAGSSASDSGGVGGRAFGRALGAGFLAFALAASALAALAGMFSQMPPLMLAGFVLFAAAAALVSELIVGLSAMHAGWFPAFATALIFLVLGMLLGFPPLPLALLVGFTAATGPAFADMGYDLKAGWILRGEGAHPAYERQGRRQQYLAELLGFAVAGVFVLLVYESYFQADLLPPVDRVYAATIAAGADPSMAVPLLLWALPGGLLQAVGGSSRQLGILFATGLLIVNPAAGWTAAVALAARGLLLRRYGPAAEGPMYVAAGGFIAGSAVTGFGLGAWRAR